MLPDWEIWLDNHISSIIAKWLNDEFGLNVKSAYALQSYTISDFEFYSRARQQGNVIIISKDSDLEKIISTHGTPPKLISIDLGNCDNRILYSILAKQIEKTLKLLVDFDKDIVHIKTTD